MTLPAWPHVQPPNALRRVHSYLQNLSWEELVSQIRELAHRHMGLDRTINPSAEYLAHVCDVLLRSQLRDDNQSGYTADDSIIAWRMFRACEVLGLEIFWKEVTNRLANGSMACLFARTMPRLFEEIEQIRNLVPRCDVACLTGGPHDVENLVRGCDVLYVCGMQDATLWLLKSFCQWRASLAVLNVCRAGKLAKHLASCGVRHVVYWPALVHDSEAARFGVAFVDFLFVHSVVDAFARSKAGISNSERVPKLINGTRKTPEDCLAGTPYVVLEQRSAIMESGKLAFTERCAKVLEHTARNGWVKVSIDGQVVSWRKGHWRQAKKNEVPAAVASSFRKANSACSETVIEPADTQLDVEEATATEADESDDEETEVEPFNEDTLIDEETQPDELRGRAQKR